ncbi:MAG: class I SAM-dependent methyltransferase [Solobacterium sp.]|nr:class I SAM-dependent methyltransferase [Solobacterium sp.]
MLDNKGFDLWADEYDQSVGLSDEKHTYPFAGYKNVLGYIYEVVMQKKNASILDIGFGTGILTTKLYEQGYTIYGQDFSSKMIALANEKMTNANLYQGDFTEGLVEPLKHQHYDFIIATYSLHHLTDNQKVSFLHSLLELLNNHGQILIGDVSFSTRKELEKCRQEHSKEWDEDEFYFVVDELRNHFPSLLFTPLSFCAGVITITT